jgi:hypothetical protein
LAIVTNVVDMEPPSISNAVKTLADTSATTNPYSTAVAPEQSVKIRFKVTASRIAAIQILKNNQ